MFSFKLLPLKKNFTTPFYGWDSTFSRLNYEERVYFLTLGPQDFLVLTESTSEGRMAVLTLEPPNSFDPKTPGLGIQHLNHQTTVHLDLPISFLYMSKHCSISVMYSQTNRFIFCTIHFSFTQLYEMLLLFSNN